MARTSSIARKVRLGCSFVALVVVWVGAFAALLPQASEAQAASVHVRTTSRPRAVWLHQRVATEAAAWVSLCPAPCEAELTRGAALGLSLDGFGVHAVPSVALADGAALQLRFDNQRLTRTYGLIVTVIGVVGALTLGLGGTTAWLSAGGQGDMTGPVTAMATAAGVLALGLSVGIVLMNEGDHVEITVAP